MSFLSVKVSAHADARCELTINLCLIHLGQNKHKVTGQRRAIIIICKHALDKD